MTTLPLRGRLFRGEKEGPRVLVTAGVHGDEYGPMAAVRRLLALFGGAPDGGGEGVALRRGALVLVPVANEAAFANGTRCAREDGLDLARVCPGNARGTVTERTAHALSRMIREADLYLDLHSGGAHYRIEPLAGYMLVEDAAVLAEQRAMARDFGLPLVWGTDASLPGRSLSVARDAGVPAIYAEYLGGRGRCARGEAACAAGVLRVLAAREMLPPGWEMPGWAPAIDGPPLVVEDPRPGSGHLQVCHPAPGGGYFEPRAELGDRIDAGAPLGEVVDFLGRERRPVAAEHSGRVVMLRSTPWVRAGDCLGVVIEDPAAATPEKVKTTTKAKKATRSARAAKPATPAKAAKPTTRSKSAKGRGRGR